MTKEQYLFLLRAELTGRMSHEEMEDILQYYTEYFEDAGPERERDVMMSLGSPQRLAEKILGQAPREEMAPMEADYRQIEEPAGTGWHISRQALIALAVIGGIVGLPTVLSVILGLGIGGVVCILVGLGVTGYGIGQFGLAAKLYLGGGGLAVLAVGLLMLLGAIALSRGVVWLVKWVYNRLREGNEE